MTSLTEPDQLWKPQAVNDMTSLWLCLKMPTRSTNVGTRESAHESLFALFRLAFPMSRFIPELGPLHFAICRDPMRSTPRISNHHTHSVCNLAKTYLDQIVWVVTEEKDRENWVDVAVKRLGKDSSTAVGPS